MKITDFNRYLTSIYFNVSIDLHVTNFNSYMALT